MKYFFAIALLILISSATLNGQEGSKIDLNNVNVGTKRLPTIFLFGQEYTSRDRNELLRGLLKSQSFKEDLKIIINLEEFTSKRIFSFRHEGPVEISVDGKKLKNQSYYNSSSSNLQTYQVRDNSRLVRLLLRIKNVRIDSSLTGILIRKSLSKEIKITENKIQEILNKSDFEIDNDTIIVRSKKKERELNKFYRLKFRQEIKYDQASVIEFKIFTY